MLLANFECELVLIELANEVGLLPASLQSRNPDLLIDYLATVFEDGDDKTLSRHVLDATNNPKCFQWGIAVYGMTRSGKEEATSIHWSFGTKRLQWLRSNPHLIFTCVRLYCLQEACTREFWPLILESPQCRVEYRSQWYWSQWRRLATRDQCCQ